MSEVDFKRDLDGVNQKQFAKVILKAMELFPDENVLNAFEHGKGIAKDDLLNRNGTLKEMFGKIDCYDQFITREEMDNVIAFFKDLENNENKERILEKLREELGLETKRQREGDKPGFRRLGKHPLDTL